MSLYCVMRIDADSRIEADLILKAQELVHVGTWVADYEPADVPDWTSCVVRWSDEMFRLFGVKPQSIPIRAETFMQFVHEDDRQRVGMAIDVAMRTKLPYRFEFRANRPDGKVRFISSRGYVECDNLGRVVRLLGTSADVTHRVKSERARAETDARLRAVFEQSAVGMAVADNNRTLITVNESFAMMLGYEIRDLLGKSFLEITHPDDVALSIASAQQSLAQPATYEKRYVRADGRFIWARVTVSALRDVAGQPAGYMGVIEDIGKRKAATEALVHSEERFRAFFEQTAVGIVIGGLDTRLRVVNPSFAKLLGYEPHELTGKTSTAFTHPDDTGLTGEMWARLGVPGACETITKRYLHRNGDTIWTRLTISRLANVDPNGDAFIAVVRDITAQRAAAETHARQTELLQGILDHMPMMVVQVDARGQLAYSNREAHRVFGWVIDGVGPPDLFAAAFPDATERARVMASIAKGGAQWEDFEPLAQDGRVVPSSWASIRLSSGGALMIGQDLSERRDMQQRLSQSQKMEALGQLAGGVAHDFNNILTIMMACATFIDEGAEKGSSTKADAREILTAGVRASGLTRQLLAFSRRQLLQPECVDVNTSLKSLAKTMYRLIGENIQVAVEANAARPNVEVDRNQLEQVVLNLAVNARDAIRDHGTITLGTRNSVDTMGREFLVLSVRDDGVGIEPSVRQRIFEPFFTTKPIGKGTGLGLATVHGIVAQSGGSIELDSVPGKGTEFRVVLPNVAACVCPTTVAEPQFVAGGTETILLVEDESSVRVLARRMLTSLGYHVIEARHGKDALELAAAQSCNIDLLVTDVVMPELGGRDLASEMRTRCPGLPVLFTSGYTDDELLRKGILDPGYKLLRKPFTKDDLARAVRGLLDAGSGPRVQQLALTGRTKAVPLPGLALR
jgi:two-component system cell cycle sensor histidine kinase/response regulator CckA